MAQSRYSDVKYMLVELQVENRHHLAFVQRMPGLIRQITARYQWEFVYAAYPLSGRLNKFVHIWRIPSEVDVLKLMVDGAVDFRQDGEDEATFNFALAYRDVQDLIRRTRHVFMAALPHDPAQLGEQTHTILIDAAGGLSIIEHAALDDRDLKIERVPVKKGDPLDIYLRRGVTCGLLPAEDGYHLFYNLAALKPLSIFQVQRVIRRDGQTVVVPFPNADADLRKFRNGGALKLAATNGKVYKLDAPALKKVAKAIPEEEFEKTNELLKPLIDGKVPLANVPTPRTLAVGEGCLCFVVNLQTFMS